MDDLTFDKFVVTLKQTDPTSASSWAVFVNGKRVSLDIYDEGASRLVAHRLLMRYGLSLRLLIDDGPAKRKEERHWEVTLPNSDWFEQTGASERLVRELVRTRLGVKRLPRGTTITEVV